MLLYVLRAARQKLPSCPLARPFPLPATDGTFTSRRIAATSLRYSPTRSMVLSGTDNHLAGLGQMGESW